MGGTNDALGEGPLTGEAVRHVARLARLELVDAQVEAYREQLGGVLGHIGRLQELDLDGVEPLAHVLEGANRMDADEPRPGLPAAALMKMAPESAPPFVRVPKVLGGGGGSSS